MLEHLKVYSEKEKEDMNRSKLKTFLLLLSHLKHKIQGSKQCASPYILTSTCSGI